MKSNEQARAIVYDNEGYIAGIYIGDARRAFSWAYRCNPDADRIALMREPDITPPAKSESRADIGDE